MQDKPVTLREMTLEEAALAAKTTLRPTTADEAVMICAQVADGYARDILRATERLPETDGMRELAKVRAETATAIAGAIRSLLDNS